MAMREKVLNFLDTQYDALDIIRINDELGLNTADELRELQDVLASLVNELIVYRTKKDKYILYSKCPNFKIGTIDVNKKGFGFLLVDDGEDIHISRDSLNYALDGDTVLVEIIDFNPERPEGRVIKVLKRDIKNVVGIIKRIDKQLVFEAMDRPSIEVALDKKSLDSSVEGEIVVVSLDGDRGKNRYYGEIRERLGHKDDPDIDIKMIAAKYEIYDEFPEDAMNQAENTPNSVSDEDKIGRVDLTDKVIFTIDGDDTKDIDDAISLDLKDGYYILGVHIADVSNYVTEHSPLDVEAYRRGTSSYLADSVIPMLPHKLSNGICSLNPDEIRCTITCEMKIDSRGHVVDTNIYPSYIKSRKKMTYKKVNDILMRNIVDPEYAEFVDVLKNMNDLAHILRKAKIRRGYIDFDLDEAKIIVDENKRVVDIEKRVREDGEKLIEDFMIVANESVASYIYYMGLPFIYRVHDIPKPEKLQEFIATCSLFGRNVNGNYNTVTSKSFQKLLEQVTTGTPEDDVLKSLAVRTTPKAYYSDENIGHFGLGSSCYTHFTSPIRRYPDLEVHRLIRTYLFLSQIDDKTIDYWQSNLDSITRQCSKREVAAVEAEREVEKMKMAEYMEDHIGEEYEGTISGVVKFGFFVQLDNMVEGLVSLESLEGDYFEYVPELLSIVGKKSKVRYKIGDKVHVRCVGASKELSQIDFDVVKDLELNNHPKKELVLNGNKK